ncbi:hypothetical protein [Flavobacterium psychrophilum]|uniref:hypothetical protein n=1 Tax=Flavobacterium psychrophilum TaxID=96345 RepID=UPI000B7C33E5|nr:hypothetical protein [Flavobacterium psychrophilum]SNB03171.1 conserved hypothetical protein [Flavobacterium psychrophilum]
MSYNVKRILKLISGFFLALCLFLVAYTSFQNGWINLSKVDKFEGIIYEKGLTTNKTSTSGRNHITLNSQVFYLKLLGLNQILAVYNPQQSYNTLENKLKINDKIKIYYKHSNLTKQINLDVFQIEKQNEVILDKQNFQGREKFAFFIAFIGGFFCLFMTFYGDRRFRRKLIKLITKKRILEDKIN